MPPQRQVALLRDWLDRQRLLVLVGLAILVLPASEGLAQHMFHGPDGGNPSGLAFQNGTLFVACSAGGAVGSTWFNGIERLCLRAETSGATGSGK